MAYNEWEQEEKDEVKNAMSKSSKILIAAILIAIWFTVCFVLKTARVISESTSLMLSIPPFIVLGIGYIVAKRNS